MVNKLQYFKKRASTVGKFVGGGEKKKKRQNYFNV